MRKEIAKQRETLESTEQNYILEFATGTGKSKMALDKMMQWYKPGDKVLIVVPRLVLFDNWRDEIRKWHYEAIMPDVTFVTYKSLPKKAGNWDTVIFDEGHHTSERCQAALLTTFKIKHFICLSATISEPIKTFFKSLGKLKLVTIAVDEAIKADLLPDSKIMILPLTLNNKVLSHVIEKKAKKGSDAKPITYNYEDKWKYRKYTGAHTIRCTQRQYYNEMSNILEWYKRKAHNSATQKIYLSKCKQRLTWLAEQKAMVVKEMLCAIQKRIVVFCASVEGSASLGIPCINSKIGTDALTQFNEGKSDRLATVEMLTEGSNLMNPEVSIFQVINPTGRLNVQKMGRGLRDKHPVFIYLFYKDTREEEVIPEIVKGFDDVTLYKTQEELLRDL